MSEIFSSSLHGKNPGLSLSDVQSVTILGGQGKAGQKEMVSEVRFEMGNVVSIVGTTGSGKTALINDIELFANANTPTNRKVLINDTTPPPELMEDPSKNPISRITQHTNFLTDLPVETFLHMHAKVRQHNSDENVVKETLDFANQLTGEPIIPENSMTELSGGQTRALLIADAVVIGNSPVLLLDEIENAGIHRGRAMELLRNYKKIFIFVTHDPKIALLSDFRIVMSNGAMQKVLYPDADEKIIAGEITKLDDLMLKFRSRLWKGERITQEDLAVGLSKLVADKMEDSS
jgi:ABC-type lipoprotein export system ATPase subunit